MHVLNIGSVNIDHVYQVAHFVRPGETISSTRYDIFAGGKGYNQSVALARAGAATRHAGCIGRDGNWLLERLAAEGADTSLVKVTDDPTGHAIIQVVPSGENAIVLHRGANAAVTPEDVARAIAASARGDYLLLQNETTSVAEALHAGKQRGMKVVFNPAPMSAAVLDYPLRDVDLLIVNETEAAGLTGEQTPAAVRRVLQERLPGTAVVLTMGRHGAAYLDASGVIRHAAIPVEAVDTTGAGDTFIGYFLAELLRGGDPARALAISSHAAALCITRPGAAGSIPAREEVLEFESAGVREC